MKNYILLLIFIGAPLVAFAQGGNYASDGNYNRAGVVAKYGLININSDSFNIEGNSAFLGGIGTRGRLYNNFGLVYGMDFLLSSMTVQGRPLGETQQEDIKYTVRGAQVHFLASYNIIKDVLAFDFGPALLINGRMKLDKNGQRDNIIQGYNSLTAEDIQQITRVNVFGIIGVTAGLEHIRFTAQYQYGLNNFFGNLDDQGLRTVDPLARDFKGTASMLTGGVVLYF